jgi:hypothetical protein
MGYDAPTPIQKYTIPSMLQGHDVIGIAQTGMIQNFFTCVNCQMLIDVA